MADLMAFLAAERNPGIPEIRSGDTVRVHVRIVEGERERIQVFQGVVIRMHKNGASSTFSVRRIAAHGIGVERTFLFSSPRINRVEIVRRAKVRRKQLTYLRKARGKAARLRDDREALEQLRKE